MRCNPARWLWGLIPVIMLTWAAFQRERQPIELDVEQRTQAELSAAGYEWARVSALGRDVTITGLARRASEPKRAREIARNVHGVRVARLRTDIGRGRTSSRKKRIARRSTRTDQRKAVTAPKDVPSPASKERFWWLDWVKPAETSSVGRTAAAPKQADDGKDEVKRYWWLDWTNTGWSSKEEDKAEKKVTDNSAPSRWFLQDKELREIERRTREIRKDTASQSARLRAEDRRRLAIERRRAEEARARYAAERAAEEARAKYLAERKAAEDRARRERNARTEAERRRLAEARRFEWEQKKASDARARRESAARRAEDSAFAAEERERLAELRRLEEQRKAFEAQAEAERAARVKVENARREAERRRRLEDERIAAEARATAEAKRRALLAERRRVAALERLARERRAVEEAKRQAAEEEARRLREANAAAQAEARRKAEADRARYVAERKAAEARAAANAERSRLLAERRAQLEVERRRLAEAKRLAARAEKKRREAELAAKEEAKLAHLSRTTTEESNACERRLRTALSRAPILFARAKSDIDKKSSVTIAKLAEIAKKCPQFRIEVEGHTDSEGTPERNQKLSERRARAVVRSLNYAGLPKRRMTAVGFGAGRPIASNATPEGMARNRRIEFRVYAK